MRRVVATLVGMVAAVAVGGATSGRSPTPVPVVIADGHVDLGPRIVDDTWIIQLKDDNLEPPVWRDLDDVILQARGPSRLTVPDDPTYAFLGAPGADVWVLPEVQQTGILWPGWNTQDPSVVDVIDREASWSLDAIEGPGELVLFLAGTFGEPRFIFDTHHPLPQETGIETDTHVHGNWAFTAPGAYRLAISLRAPTTDGRSLEASGVLRVFVGDGDPVAAYLQVSSPEPATHEISSPSPGDG